MPDRQKALAWVLLLVLSIIWGSSFILIKKGLVYFDPNQVASLRILSASVILFPFAIVRLKRVKKAHVWSLISVGFAGSLLPAFLFSIAQTKLDSSSAGVLNALTPLWVIILGVSLFHQKVKGQTLVGMALGFIGSALLVLLGSNTINGMNYYGLLVLGATICYGFNLNLIKYKLQDLDAVTITSVSLIIVGPMAFGILFFFTDFTNTFSLENAIFLSFSGIVFLGVMGTAVALIIFNNLVQITTPIFTSSVTYFIPIVAIIWGVLDGETITGFQAMGMGLILLGVFIANKSK